MLAQERQNAIVEQVNREGSVRVKELSEKYQVTEDSIRKDLTHLEKKGLLKKTYGGAMRVRIQMHEFNVQERKVKNLREKQAIAEKALHLIKDRDTVFLDISTANTELAKLLIQSEKKEVTVVTNMIDVMMICSAQSRVKLIFLGGTFYSQKDGFVGTLTVEQLGRYRFDLAFLGVVGVDLENDRVTVYVPEDGITKQHALMNSNRAYMMLEEHKLHEDGTYCYAKVSDFKGAVLDKEPDAVCQKKMQNYTLDWIWKDETANTGKI